LRKDVILHCIDKNAIIQNLPTGCDMTEGEDIIVVIASSLRDRRIRRYTAKDIAKLTKIELKAAAMSATATLLFLWGR
jgi:hypothetical protein